MRRSWRSSCGAMRMAMSCLAFPETGRPTLRARRSSASVDSGMSERSSLLPGIGLAFFAGRLARADDANDFLVIFHPPGRVNDDQNPASDRSSQTVGVNFGVGVFWIVPVERVRVSENSGRLLERDTVLLQVAQGFPSVPREHIIVYTLIQRGCKEEAAAVAREWKKVESRNQEFQRCNDWLTESTILGRESIGGS